MTVTKSISLQGDVFGFLTTGSGGGVLLGWLFYQKDCTEALGKHSTVKKLSNQIH